MFIYLCASGDSIMLGCFMKYCLRVCLFRTGLKASFLGFFKVDASGFFKGEVSIPFKKIFHENLKYISNTYLYLHDQLLEVYSSLVYAGTDQKINSGAICQNKTAKEIFNIPESFTIFLEGICQMPDTKKPVRSPNIFFHIPVLFISKVAIVLFLLL